MAVVPQVPWVLLEERLQSPTPERVLPWRRLAAAVAAKGRPIPAAAAAVVAERSSPGVMVLRVFPVTAAILTSRGPPRAKA